MKRRDERVTVAVVSLLAAVAIILTKVVAYEVTGSLSVLAEVLHSSLDLLATFVTLSAIRYATKPADSGHQYGHGKAENLGGLAGGVLIMVTSIWIFYEGINRLNHEVSFSPSIIAVIVMGISIVVDFWRSRELSRAAKKYNSQALEADALHFYSDLFSSGTVMAVVGIGLILNMFPMVSKTILIYVDVGVAMLVSAYFAWSSYKLSRRAISELLDRAPTDIVRDVEKTARENEGVLDVRNMRSRRSGSRVFIDMTVAVPEGTSILTAHEISSKVERSVRASHKEIDLIIHIEPSIRNELREFIKLTSLNTPGIIGVHNILVSELDGSSHVRLHVNVDPNCTVDDAHKISDELENNLIEDNHNISLVTVHTDPKITIRGYDLVSSIKSLLAKVHGIKAENVLIERIGEVTYVDVKCSTKGSASLIDSHDAITLIEDNVKEIIGGDVHVTIHLEPMEKRPHPKKTHLKRK